MDDHADSLTSNFNKHGVGDMLGHVAKHVVVMGAMMGVIALVSPVAAASVVGADPATLGNLAVQTVHGSWEMLGMIGDTLSGLLTIGGDLIGNTLSGNWAPTTLDSMIMGHDMGGAAHMAVHSVGAANGGVHATLEHAIASSFSSPMDWFDSLSVSDQMQMREDAALFGVPFDEYVEDLCATEHPQI